MHTIFHSLAPERVRLLHVATILSLARPVRILPKWVKIYFLADLRNVPLEQVSICQKWRGGTIKGKKKLPSNGISGRIKFLSRSLPRSSRLLIYVYIYKQNFTNKQYFTRAYRLRSINVGFIHTRIYAIPGR